MDSQYQVGSPRDIISDTYSGFLKRPADDQALSYWLGLMEHGLPVSELIRALIQSDEYRELNRAKLFAPPGHFYSPVVDVREAEIVYRKLDASSCIQDTVPGIGIEADAIKSMWATLLPSMLQFPFSAEGSDKYRFYTNNDAYGFGDAVVLYAILNYFRPKRLIEIGSGFSSVCSLDTLEMITNHPFEATFVDPNPALLLSLVGAESNIRVLEKPVQEVPLETFEPLGRNDVLFIDSTHIMKTGSDVCYELFEILPKLKPGVLVHIHDMFWPFEYPRQWGVDQNRSWNELYGVRAFLTNNAAWEIVFFNDYMAKVAPDIVRGTLPRFLENPGGGLWLRRREEAGNDV